MMTDLPTLIVDGNTADCLRAFLDLSFDVCVGGPLPTVPCDIDMCRNGREGYWADGGECGYCMGTLSRPLRAGDRVTLRTMCPNVDSWGDPCEGNYEIAQSEWRPCPLCDGKKGKPGTVPFATATVAHIARTVPYTEGTWLVTVTDVQPLDTHRTGRRV